MDTLFVIFTTLLSYVHSIPVDSSATISREDNPNCGARLTNQIELCLIPFEQKLVVYRDPTTTDYEKARMRVAFCQEYEETLQCLHTVLLQCPSPPTLEHLNIIEKRIGYLRAFMDSTCRVPLEAMTPKPTSTPMTSTTMTTRILTSASTLWRAIITTPKGASKDTPRLIVLERVTPEVTTTSTTVVPTTTTVPPTTTFNVGLLTDKLNKLQETTSKPENSPNPVVELEIRDKNSIPMENLIPSNFDTSAVEDNIIRVSNTNCENKPGQLNPHCTMLLTQSSASVQTVTVVSVIFTLLNMALLL